ncbi:MAG: OmpA family protein [Acidobacteriota bacterium]
MMTPSETPRRFRVACLAGATFMALGLSACHTTPPRNAQLEQARTIYRNASASPDVTRAAPLELERARKSLYQAEQAWTEHRNEAETEHLAYVAAQQAQVALNIGMQSAADNMVTSAGVERERIQAEVNAKQAQNAQSQAQDAQARAQSANQRADQLEQELQQLSAQKTKRGLVVVLQDVLFDVGKADLKEGARSRLEKLASALTNNPDRHVLIEGFTDSTGSAELNQKLSEERAQSVKDALTALGISADRIETKGFGKQRPVATNKTAAGRQQNRRVEVVFSNANGAFNAQ